MPACTISACKHPCLISFDNFFFCACVNQDPRSNKRALNVQERYLVSKYASYRLSQQTDSGEILEESPRQSSKAS